MFLLNDIVLSLCILSTVVVAKTAASVSNASTCPARTANYITHSLPQQCLTSTRIGTMRQSSIPDVTLSVTAAGDSTGSVSVRTDIAASLSVSSPSESSTTSDFTSSAGNDEAQSTSPTEVSTTTIVATSISSSTQISILPPLIDEESALESGNFLSFEDWKKQNLIKAGQSEHVGKDAGIEQKEPRKRPSAVQNSLDSLGDDVEIDLDFSGLVPGGPQKQDGHSSVQTAHSALSQENIDTNTQPNARARSKDAGTTCKERFNYASFDCAANILKNNPQAKNPRSVLIENKDAYMLNECSAKEKFLILELCDDLLIDTIVLANFEFFSSIFRQVHVSVSDRYPVKTDKWKTLGTFEARNTREVQAFLVENPVIWARYLRIQFLTHYGSEYFCPVSLVRVHGTTMLEEYKHDLEMSLGGSDDDDDDSVEVALSEGKEVDILIPEAIDETLFAKIVEDTEDARDSEATLENRKADADTEQVHAQRSIDTSSENTARPDQLTSTSSPMDMDPSVMFSHSLPTSPMDSEHDYDEESKQDRLRMSTEPAGLLSSPRVSASESFPSQAPAIPAISTESSKVNKKASETKHQTSVQQPSSAASNNGNTPGVASTRNGTSSVDRARSSSSTATERRSTGSATQSNPASPTMQESFFKSVQKRLQMLESNSSLSLQYIEEQSRSLRDAFRKVEQRQLSKTSAFLDHLNLTMLSELREFRQQYDHLWQSTVIELEMQREQYQQENSAMHARLGVLADELIFQKRLAILQMTLILVCLGLVLFSRGVIHNYLELPLVQSVLSKSPRRRWMNLSTDTTPNGPPLERAHSAYQLRTKPSILKGHKRGQSNESDIAQSEQMSPSIRYSPPTPVSYDDFSEPESFREDGLIGNTLDFDPSTIERPSTSPPVLPSLDESSTPPRFNEDSKTTSIEARLLGTPPSSVERNGSTFRVKIDEATPRSKHLTWDLPNI